MELNKESRFIGIDPGKMGCVVTIDIAGKILYADDTPLIGKAYDKAKMLLCLEWQNDFSELRHHAVLEDVHGNQMGGIHNNFDLGNGKGLWEMALMSLRIPHTLVAPKAWQKEMYQGVKLQYKSTKRITKAGNSVKKLDTKASSLLAAKQLQPNENWHNVSTKTGKVLSSINDGKVDAYLMAEYCRRKFK